MPELTLLAAFSAGLLGSAHCLAMCGGIATALGGATRERRWWQPLLYNCGRTASYAVAGAVAGAVGASVGFAPGVTHWGEILRLGTALAVVIIGLDISLGTSVRTRWLRAPERWGALLWRRVLPARQLSWPSSAALRAALAGAVWGWLPCGLVYSVLFAAALAGGALSGAATMLAFGVGTLPAMTGLSFVGVRLPRPHGTAARLLGATLVACGLWTAVTPIAALTGAQAHEHHPMRQFAAH
jgi:sulfite exporter TauE/SafE